MPEEHRVERMVGIEEVEVTEEARGRGSSGSRLDEGKERSHTGPARNLRCSVHWFPPLSLATARVPCPRSFHPRGQVQTYPTRSPRRPAEIRLKLVPIRSAGGQRWFHSDARTGNPWALKAHEGLEQRRRGWHTAKDQLARSERMSRKLASVGRLRTPTLARLLRPTRSRRQHCKSRNLLPR